MPEDKPKFEDTQEIKAPSFEDTVPVGEKKKDSNTPSPPPSLLASTGGESGSETGALVPSGINYLEGNNFMAPAPVPVTDGIPQPQIRAALTPGETTAKSNVNFDPDIAQKQEALNPKKEAIARGIAQASNYILKSPAGMYDALALVGNIYGKTFNTGHGEIPYFSEIGDKDGLYKSAVDQMDAAIERSKQEKSKRYDNDVSGYLFGDKKNISKGISLMFENVLEMVPTSVALGFAIAQNPTMANSVGASAFFADAKKKMDEKEELKDMPEDQKALWAAIMGSTEMVSENLGVSKLGPLFKGILEKSGKEALDVAGKELYQNTMGKVMKRYFGIQGEEVGSELVNNTLQNIYAAASGLDPNRKPFDNSLETFLAAASLGVTLTGPVALLDIAKTRKAVKKASELADQKQALTNDLQSPDVSPEIKPALSKKIQDINEEEANVAIEEKEKFNNLTPEGQQQINDLQKKANEIASAAVNETVSEETKEILKKDLDEVDKQIDKVYEESKKEKPAEKPKEEPPNTDIQDEIDYLTEVKNSVGLDQAETARLEELTNQKQKTNGEKTSEGQQAQETDVLTSETVTDKQSVTVAPFFDATVESAEEADKIRKSPAYKQHVEEVHKVAESLGIKGLKVINNVGGFKNNEGQRIREVSDTFEFAGTFEQAKQLGALLGTLSPEVQESSMAIEYVKEENRKSIEVHIPVKDVDVAAKALEDAGIDNFSIDSNSKIVKILDTDNQNNVEFNKKVRNFIEQENTNGKTKYKPANHAFIGGAERSGILASMRTGREQRGSSLGNYVQKAQARDTEFNRQNTPEIKAAREEYSSLRDKQKEGKSLSSEEEKRLTELSEQLLPNLKETFSNAEADYKQAKEEIDAVAEKAVGKKGFVVPFGIKKAARAAIKALRWYKGKAQWLGDGARTNIVVNSAKDAQAVFKDLENQYEGGIIRNDNKETDLGYPKQLLEVRTSNGKLAEFQVMTPEGYIAKDGIKEFPESKRDVAEKALDKVREKLGWDIPDGVGHYFYEVNRDNNAPKELRDQAQEISKKYYDAFLNPESKVTEKEFRDAVSDFKNKVDAADKKGWDEGNKGVSPETLNEFLATNDNKRQQTDKGLVDEEDQADTKDSPEALTALDKDIEAMKQMNTSDLAEKKFVGTDIEGETRKKKTVARQETTFKEVVAEMTENEKFYTSIKQNAVEPHISKILDEVRSSGGLEQMAEAMLKGENPFHEKIAQVAAALTAERLNILAEKEGNEMQKNALRKLAAKLFVARNKVINVSATQTALEAIIAQRLPLSEEGLKAYATEAMSSVQDTYFSEQQKKDVEQATKDINEILESEEGKKAIREAVEAEIDRIAEATNGKEWVAKVNEAIDNLMIDLKDC